MKHLPKHLQPRWRYLAVSIEAWPDADFDRAQFQRRLWYAAQNLVGDAGSADLDLTVVRFSLDAGAGSVIVRVRRGSVDRARAVVATLEEIDGAAVGLRVRGVSGTVRACEEKYLGRAPEASEQRDVVFADDDCRAHVREVGVDVRRDGTFVGATEIDLQ